MSVADGQPVSAAYTNPAFLKPDVDDYTVNRLGSRNSISGSGFFVADLQKYLNNLGKIAGLNVSGNYSAEADTTGNTYGAPYAIADGDSFKVALTKISTLFSSNGTGLAVLGFANGGTGAADATDAFNGLAPFNDTYQFLYSGTAGTALLLANTTTTKKFITMTGTGTAGTAPTWTALSSSDIAAAGAWVLGGQVLGATKVFGSTDANDISFITNNIERLRMSSGGFLGLGNITPNGQLDMTGAFSVRRGATNSTTGSQNDLSTSAISSLLFTGASAQTVTGFANGYDGKILFVLNAAATALTLSNANSGSMAANRIATGSGNDLPLGAGGACVLVYDATSSLWRVAGGGGGGSSSRTVSSFTGASIAPLTSGAQTFLYAGTSAQVFTGFGTISGFSNGLRITIMCSDNTNTLEIDNSDTTNGWLVDGVFFGAYGSVIEFEYNSTLARMVEVFRS